MSDFYDLPKRIFLDSCTVQTLRKYDAFIYEGEPIDRQDRIHCVSNGIANVEALRDIFRLNDRAQFEWIVSKGSIEEGQAKGDPGHLQWLFDIADHASICLENNTPTDDSLNISLRLNEKRFDNISKKDKRLLQEAIFFRCDAFLTVERRLATRSDHIRSHLGIRILTPPAHWQLLKPYKALWF